MFGHLDSLRIGKAVLSFLLLAIAGAEHTPVASDIDAVFDNITPSSHLVWHSCTDLYFCARLALPLDPDAPQLGDVAIALIMFPGDHGSDPTNYTESPLLVNPGGPGGSGIEFIFRRGQQLRKIVGADIDILAFDPRGVAHSTPSLDCFAPPSSQLDSLTPSMIRRQLWKQTGYHISPSGVDDQVSVSTVYNRNSALSQLCVARDEALGKASIFRYASTPYVAQDMIGIVDAWAQWRRDGKAMTIPQPLDVSFWGFSYGTLLGATFAAMFPDRVGRLVIDGVVDSKKWWDGQLIDDYVDSEKILRRFADYCQDAGTMCSFYKPNGSAKDIDSRLHKILRSLERSPVAVVDRKTSMPAVITHGFVTNMLFESLYKTMTEFPIVADCLAAIESGNITRMGEMARLPSNTLATRTQLQHYLAHPLVTVYNEAATAVVCGDQQNRTDLSMEHIRQTFRRSSAFTTVFTSEVLRDCFNCIDWKISPTRQLPPTLYLDTDGKDFSPVKTKNPILVVTTSLDPICPFHSALAMVPRFANASLLEIETEGHCSVSRASLCGARAIRKFFKTGDTPYTDLENGKWLRCQADDAPWFPFNQSAALPSIIAPQIVLDSSMQHNGEQDISDRELMEAWTSIGEVLPRR